MAYATDDIATLRKAMHSLARYPAELGPIRLVGVGFSGLEAERQDVLFPELDQAMVSTETRFDEETTVADRTWHATQDVFHPEYGHGWIQVPGTALSACALKPGQLALGHLNPSLPMMTNYNRRIRSIPSLGYR